VTDHVSCGGPRPVHRSAHRSGCRSVSRSMLDRCSIDAWWVCRPSVGRVSNETRLTINRYIGRHIGRYVCTHMSAAIVDTSPIPHRYFTDTPPILHRYFIITSPSISVDISVATRSIPRSVLCRYDILPTHRQQPIVGRYLDQFRTSIGRCLDRYYVDKEPL